MASQSTGKEFTGRKMLLVTVGSFSIIIAVNLVLAFKAVSTFPGLEVENSYVASQTFDAERKAQLALGWKASVAYRDGAFRLGLVGPDGAPAEVKSVSAMVGRSTERKDDQTPELVFDGNDWSAPATLAPGYWQVWVNAVAPDGTEFRQRLDLHIAG